MTPPVGTRLHPTGRLIPEGLDEAMVRAVVDDFYRKARRDDGDRPDLQPGDRRCRLAEHLDKITSFWSSMLLGAGTYNGRPMPRHLAIGDLADPHFVRWLALFRRNRRAALSARCGPPLFVDRAERVAQSLRLGLAQHRGLDSLSITPLRAGEL
jgi:hemoglobin